MSKFELIMPKMGESVAEATIISWLKNVGDKIKVDETVIEIATDKVDSEVPSSVEGILIEKKFKENDVVKVGEIFGLIEIKSTTESTNKVDSDDNSNDKNNNSLDLIDDINLKKITSNIIESTTSLDKNNFLSPLVKSIIRKENIKSDEVAKIKGTGNEGRITKSDIISYLHSKSLNVKEIKKIPTEKTYNNEINTDKYIAKISENSEIVVMDRMRMMISDHMVSSKKISPHVTSFVEADVTKIVTWREKNKNIFFMRENEKITFTPIFLKSLAKTIKSYPMVNVSVDRNKIIKHRNINIGLAVALPNGNLIVPVIKDADERSLIGMTKKVNDLSRRARENKLNPDEITQGTFTLTNVGTFGNIMGTPIINQPQVAILAVGAIKKKPSVIETEYGDVIAIRHKMFCSLSYDHRVVDGALGGSFLNSFAKDLENFNSETEI